MDNPPEPFATALRDGWTDAARERLAAEAAAFMERHEGWLATLRAGGEDTVRFDCGPDTCEVCEPYCGSAYSITGATDGLPLAPPLPICPACRHTLNLLTPFFLRGIGRDLDDMIDSARPFTG